MLTKRVFSDCILDRGRQPVFDLYQRSAKSLSKRSYCVVYNAISDDGMRKLHTEVADLEQTATRTDAFHNMYTSNTENISAGKHATNMIHRVALSVVAADAIPQESLISRLYRSDEMLALVQAMTRTQNLFRFSDPQSSINVTYMRSGDVVGWHFDYCDYVMALVLKAPRHGGHFQIAPASKWTGNPNYDDTAKIIENPNAWAPRVAYNEASLVLFAGRNSLHRITSIGPGSERVVVLFAYDRQPDTETAEVLKNLRYNSGPGTK